MLEWYRLLCVLLIDESMFKRFRKLLVFLLAKALCISTWCLISCSSDHKVLMLEWFLCCWASAPPPRASFLNVTVNLFVYWKISDQANTSCSNGFASCFQFVIEQKLNVQNASVLLLCFWSHNKNIVQMASCWVSEPEACMLTWICFVSARRIVCLGWFLCGCTSDSKRHHLQIASWSLIERRLHVRMDSIVCFAFLIEQRSRDQSVS